MCGVAAIFAYHYTASPVDREELQEVRDSMESRGPDGAGEWYSEDGRVGLAHRRLAIIDLSERGAQPMESQDGTLVISFNGEIYNYQEIRAHLQKKGYLFRSRSDTEVLLQLYQEKGEAMVYDLRGMFAFVLWDDKKKVMLLARDPYGIKPLYYANDGWTVRVTSQVKALLKSEKVSKRPEPAGMVGFFLTGSVPEPYTLYQEIRQVPAGSIVSVNSLGPSAPKQYFSIAETFLNAGERACGDGDTAREALLDSVHHHFVSDVPVGIFLSSGIDSSSLVGLTREAGIEETQTLTLAFDEFQGGSQDEAPLAEKIARLYGTKHHTFVLTKREFQAELPRVLERMDQPSIDGINTYFVSKTGAQIGLKVALSGLGGDELFGGYPSFREIPRLARALAIPSRIPFLGSLSRRIISSLLSQFSTISPKYGGVLKYGGTYPGAYFLKRGLFMPWELETVLNEETAREGLRRLRLHAHFREAMEPDSKSPFARVATLEASLYLRNQLLRDTDWAGMAHSLEIRTPFVDASLLKILAPILISNSKSKHDFNQKQLLSDSLNAPLPDEVLHRSKTGFNVPVDKWLEEDETIDGWRKVPNLARKGCPWARRWAYGVMEREKGMASEFVAKGCR